MKYVIAYVIALIFGTAAFAAWTLKPQLFVNVEAGQVWCREVTGNPFGSEPHRCAAVLALKGGWVQYQEDIYDFPSEIEVSSFLWRRELQE